ncbi:MAG: hypothetical protein UW37_C0008G0022 [Candidatus Gottesmanbacteria bacterium GW2011_GWA2_44_17]|uniref:UPF0102 protein UW52_C0010G0023 n=3 Tax=Candidatus Gottesmaniibacteriota TaxID=1752720 RepID=A0A0G1IQB7_9BACT|nr:MAG: hypothetical protein UV63_C0032G0013 [Microgenomates group bacterium GW2011_GWC1_43_11]KKT36516.1 MAG: hypothetical protein UW22_C0037G0014 [Candidatus Gottesmanbacteria bacterium GW2011_GWB1_44_11c]KKT47422.1 MAG: hypothetical protein UW37_C0008G0022 [Candidatus Gottesmanbacteria bacterium GW2011_GWA2_44_17]KKT61128.1 MAG: hypothetical protein UW52_C0010G0023 [Candidatus Gottesmanbacteria bacterium GW2011_GWA1_44_24b]HCM82095.1 YraN family protein [Patescibacteria group bacterium]
MNPQACHKQNLGKHGESLACDYLEKHGYGIIDRNFKARYGEIDIIATKDKILVFIEVKTRINQKYGSPEEAVTPRKIKEVIATAAYYSLLHSDLPTSHRIDVIAIQLFPDRTIQDLRHIENITQ